MQNLPQVAFFVYVMYTVSANISESESVWVQEVFWGGFYKYWSMHNAVVIYATDRQTVKVASTEAANL